MFFALIQLITPIKRLITRIIIQYERKSTNKVMDRVKNIRLQPIFDLHNAQIFGYEVLSEISTTTDNEAWFHHQSANQLLALYQWQLQQPELLSIKGMLFLNLPFAALQLPEIEKQLAGKPRNTIIEMQDPEILLTMNAEQVMKLRQQLAKLSRAGLSIWLDDYHPNYSAALNQLNWHFGGVKIDRHAFQMHRHSPDMLIELVNRARRYGSNILIEGIETEDDLFAVLQSSADLAQGFFWSELRIPVIH